MSSRIEQIIDEMEDYLEHCKPKFMSNDEIIVNKEQIDELLRELRMRTPEEIKHYQKIISQKEAILDDARAKAEQLIRETEIQTTELVSEHEIMQQAYAQANEVVDLATRQAQQILDSAATEANAVREAATEYMDRMLAYLEDVLTSAASKASMQYGDLIGTLNQYKDTITENRQELRPAPAQDASESGPSVDFM